MKKLFVAALALGMSAGAYANARHQQALLHKTTVIVNQNPGPQCPPPPEPCQ